MPTARSHKLRLREGTKRTKLYVYIPRGLAPKWLELGEIQVMVRDGNLSVVPRGGFKP